MGRFDKAKGAWITEPRARIDPSTGFQITVDDDVPPESLVKSLIIPSEMKAELVKISELTIFEEVDYNELIGNPVPRISKSAFIDEVKLKIQDKSGQYYHLWRLDGKAGHATAYEICKTLDLKISEDQKFYKKKKMKIVNLDTLFEGKDTRIDSLEKENKEIRNELDKVKTALADTLDLLQSLARARSAPVVKNDSWRVR